MTPTEPFLPEHIRAGVTGWIERGDVPGGFLCAVIRNDLADAIGRADHINIQYISNIVSWFWNEAPAPCWGSPEKFNHWIEIHKHRKAGHEI